MLQVMGLVDFVQHTCTACSQRVSRTKSARAEWCGPMCCPHAAIARSLRDSPALHQTSAKSMGMAGAVGGKVAPIEEQQDSPLPTTSLICPLISFVCPDQVGRTKCIPFSNRRTCCPVMLSCVFQVKQGPVELFELSIPMELRTQFNYHQSAACPLWQCVCRQNRHILPLLTMHRNWCSQPLILLSPLGSCARPRGCLCLHAISPLSPLLL